MWIGFAGRAVFPLLAMNLAHLVKDERYFLLVFTLLDLRMYSLILAAKIALTDESRSMPDASTMSCTFFSTSKSEIKNFQIMTIKIRGVMLACQIFCAPRIYRLRLYLSR